MRGDRHVRQSKQRVIGRQRLRVGHVQASRTDLSSLRFTRFSQNNAVDQIG